MADETLRLFALDESRDLGGKIAAALGRPLAAHEERDFEDGEHKCRPLENVRSRDVFVIQSLYSDAEISVNDKLCRLLFFIGALKDASAARVTAVVPYLCYSRKDSKTKARDPVSTRYVAQLLESVGADRVVTLDVHNGAAFQNAFRCPTEHLEARRLFVEHFAPLVESQPVVVVSPDVGGAKRVEEFRQSLSRRLAQDIKSAFMEKYRSEGELTGEAVVGDIHGKTAIILDDLISTGRTMARAARACRQRGAARVCAAATHGLFVGDAEKNLAEAGLERLVITDTIPASRLKSDAVRDTLTVLDTAPLLAAAIHRIHTGGSLVELTERV
jgi:ribose-phosphate pyrophosphokinase